MIAGAFLRTDLTVDPRVLKALCEPCAQQQVIDPKPGIAGPAIALIVPESVYRRLGMQAPDRVDPALIEQASKEGAAFRLEKRVLVIGLGRINIAIGRHHVVVTGKDHREVGAIEFRGMRRQTLHPGELVVEFWAGLRVPVGPIQRGYEHAVHRRLDIATLRVGGITGQFGACYNRFAIASQNGHAIP